MIIKELDHRYLMCMLDPQAVRILSLVTNLFFLKTAEYWETDRLIAYTKEPIMIGVSKLVLHVFNEASNDVFFDRRIPDTYSFGDKKGAQRKR